MGRFQAREHLLAAYPNHDFNFWMTSYDFCQDLKSTHATHNTETFTYLTETWVTTATTQVDSIDATQKIVTFEAATTLQTDGIAAGDYFILDEDHTSDEEPDSSWKVIASVDSETQLTLSSAYGKAVTSPGNDDAKIRKVYTGPGTNGSWGHCVVNDTLIFCNKNDYVQKFAPADTYASAVDTTNAVNWKYCVTFANRAILANEQTSGDTDALGIQWSKENDPTDWTDSTAGSASLESTADELTGLGKLGSYLVVFTPNSMIFGYRTGVATSPIAFQDEKVGIGAYAPNSIIHANGTIYFMGQHNFYKLDGTTAVPIGNAVREEIFENEVPDNVKLFKVAHNPLEHEIWWFKSHDQYAYVYDYLREIWNVYKFVGDSIYLHAGSLGMKEHNDKDDTFFLGVSSNDLSTTTKTVIYSSSYLADNSTAISCSYRTRKTDFSDQDPEALNRWKTVYMVRFIYRDLTNSTPYALYLYKEDPSGIVSVGTNTVGTATGYINTTDFTTIQTANCFEFRTYESSTNKQIELLGIEVYYTLGGAFFDI
jgi:hypothetical protein